MEISFEGREALIYKEYACQIRRIQESAESVVPDTEADIQKIAGIQSGVLLKSKDLSSRGVTISGELYASVLYIQEGEQGIGSIRIRKPFTIEYDVEGLESEMLAQISLLLQGTDVRLVNPRKISMSFDVEGQLFCYRSESLCIDASLPENTGGLHARMEEQTITLPKAVCEKSVTVNEQFLFTEGQTAPNEIISEKTQLLAADCQLIGSKVIIKGSVEINACGLNEDALPALYSFSTPFSQIIDVGVESMRFCTVRPEITGAYFDLIDTISGGKALDMELHAVLQIVCCEDRQIRCVADAYSNVMPAQLISQTQEFAITSSLSAENLSGEERVSLMEKCDELLCVLASPSRLTADSGKLSAGMTLDFLFRNGEGKLSACRRTIALSEDVGERRLRVLNIGSIRCSEKLDGEFADCSVSIELQCAESKKESISGIRGVVLNEENPYVQGSLPTLTLVRREGESLWNLAKRYHSSEERIREMNEDADTSVRMLLIPKCL